MAVLSVLLGGVYVLSKPPDSGDIQATLSVTQALGGDTNGLARAVTPRVFSCPRDHGPHPAYRTEWWYYTGNVQTASGRHFGFQLTIFRSALAAEVAARDSAWGTAHVYMAHLALTDVETGRLYAFERFSRAALGLAGARAEPFQVWVEDWSVEGQNPDGLPMRLWAGQSELTLDLQLRSAKPIVLQGDHGLSHKGPEAGNASYYYSLTRMPTEGTIRIADETFQVSGTSWMDREWSTSVLGTDQVGWDWFALQLSDGSEVMFFQLRRADGQADVFSSGTLVRPNGETVGLKHADVRIEVQDYWHSPRSGGRYPARWRFQIPAENLALELSPYVADQELPLSVQYWEGAINIQGQANDQPLEGHGYVEMTGYHTPAGQEKNYTQGRL
jgi:predicted secreted hydrolase